MVRAGGGGGGRCRLGADTAPRAHDRERRHGWVSARPSGAVAWTQADFPPRFHPPLHGTQAREGCLPSGWLLAPTGSLAGHPLRWRRESLACTRPGRGQPEARSPVSLVEETGWTGRPRPGPGPGPARGVYHALLSLLVGMFVPSLRKVKRIRKWKMASGWGVGSEGGMDAAPTWHLAMMTEL